MKQKSMEKMDVLTKDKLGTKENLNKKNIK